MDQKLLSQAVENIFFGVEVETCFHIVGKEFKSDVEAMKAFYRCMKKKAETMEEDIFQWDLILDSEERSTTYRHFIVMPDHSVACSTKNKKEKNKACIQHGTKIPINMCSDINFYPIEIISPKLSMGDFFTEHKFSGLDILAYVWYGWVYADNIVYTVNDTQGLHVNLSHPNMDVKKFLDWWVAYEPVILQTLPLYRREEILFMGYPLSKIKGDIYEKSKDKYISVRTHADRIEIRIGQGVTDFYDIYYWTVFCILFMAATISSQNTVPKFDYENKQEIVTSFTSLLNFILDDTIQRVLLERYNNNRDTALPSIVFSPSNVHIVSYPWKNWSDEIQKKVLEMRYSVC